MSHVVGEFVEPLKDKRVELVFLVAWEVLEHDRRERSQQFQQFL